MGNSYQEALLKEVIELQTRALLRPISLPAEEVRKYRTVWIYGILR